MTTHTATTWSAEVVHPDTGRVLAADVLDAPDIRPSINALPEVRLPVRRDAGWLDPVFDDDPELRVWREGVRQPIDVLRDVEHQPDGDRTVLVGLGGVELEQRVRKYYDLERRYTAAEDLITGETSYAADVDIPQADDTNELLRSIDTTAEWESDVATTATDPVREVNGTARPAQTAFVRPYYTIGTFGGSGTLTNGDEYVDGEAFRYFGEGGYVEFDFTLDYDIPAGEFFVGIRGEEDQTGGSVVIEVLLDGSNIDFLTIGGSNMDWDTEDPGIGSVSAGTHTLRFEAFNVETDEEGIADMFVGYDGRYSYDFDNTLSEPGGHLDGPQLFPQTTPVPTDDFASQFVVVGGQADATVDTAAPPAYVQVSNDQGANYFPNDGTEDDTTSVDVDFPDDGATLRGRVGLDRYGTRDGDTPRTGYQAQALDSLDLSADLVRLYLLLDEDRDASIAEILTFLTADTRYLWSYQLDSNGDGKVVFTQPGQRVSDRSPELTEASIQKSGTTYPKVTVKGSPQQVSGEQFTASQTYVDLAEAALIGGSESVRDPDTGAQYIRGTDYELNRDPGEIRITSGSDMTAGEMYEISYAAEIAGTYTDPNAGADPRELVRQISGVTSQQQAEQAAFVLVSELADPRYAGDVIVPSDRIGFNPAEALPLDDLGLPDAATPLEVETDPEITPRGLRLRLGSRDTLEQSLSRVREQLAAVSKRT